MEGGRRFTGLAPLSRAWRRWTDIVELFAQRRTARWSVQHESYRALHRELLENCECLPTDEVTEALLKEYLLELAQPWVTPQALADAEQEILAALAERC